MARARQETMARMYELHAAALWRYAWRLTGDRQLAEDIVQETLCRAWKSRKLMEQDPQTTRAWLFTVARHLVIDESRSARYRREVPGLEQLEPVREDQTEQLFDSMVVIDALAALSEEHRQVIVRAYVGGRSTSEMAQELGIAAGTVKSRLHYGMRALRLALEERGAGS
ncbi:sigma-70 family RNA polymerase sigma factor [Glutamicibacter endophyticus]|uniref:sigma-70 family RNA polymerase sigma factor n=1 Tax=Glutamicibacter endophyticus TaxID=1522174 RepID=UPI003AF0538B